MSYNQREGNSGIFADKGQEKSHFSPMVDFDSGMEIVLLQ